MGTLSTSKTYNVERPAALTLITGPGSEPVTLAEMKEYLYLVDGDQDSTINDCIGAAREQLEAFLDRSILSQTWELALDEFPEHCRRTPDAEILLPRPTISSITSVKYYDDDGTLQTWGASNYRLDAAAEPGRLTTAYGVSWPSTRAMTAAIQVRYVAASWASAALVPRGIKMWIKARAAHHFAQRGQVVTGTIVADLPDLDHLVERWRIRRFT